MYRCSDGCVFCRVHRPGLLRAMSPLISIKAVEVVTVKKNILSSQHKATQLFMLSWSSEAWLTGVMMSDDLVHQFRKLVSSMSYPELKQASELLASELQTTEACMVMCFAISLILIRLSLRLLSYLVHAIHKQICWHICLNANSFLVFFTGH